MRVTQTTSKIIYGNMAIKLWLRRWLSWRQEALFLLDLIKANFSWKHCFAEAGSEGAEKSRQFLQWKTRAAAAIRSILHHHCKPVTKTSASTAYWKCDRIESYSSIWNNLILFAPYQVFCFIMADLFPRNLEQWNDLGRHFPTNKKWYFINYNLLIKIGTYVRIPF